MARHFNPAFEKATGLNKVTADVRDELDAGSDHKFNCDCDTCLTWWAHVGPEDEVPGSYGPFTVEQVNTRQRELGVLVTP